MFKFLRSKNIDTDVTTNPDILFNSSIKASEIKLHRLGLLDSVYKIPIGQISRTTFEKYPADGLRFPNGNTKRTLKDGKVFYESVDGQKEYLLKDRIQSVSDFGGMLGLYSGATYVIQNKIIIGFGIRGDLMVPYRNISKDEVEIKFGKASKIDELLELPGGKVWCSIYYYPDREMAIYFIERDHEISFINIGKFPYSSDNMP